MFGPQMCFEAGEGLKVKMAPLTRDDMPEYIRGGGMQSLNVTRYLNRRVAPTLEDEYEWFDRVRADDGQLNWGIYVIPEGSDDWKLVGGTSYGYVNCFLKTATSGVLLFDQDYWGKGIVSACHRARTYYAFCEDGVVCIRSEVVIGNEGSDKAIRGIGYVPVFVERNFGMHAGQVLHAQCYQLINPIDRFWEQWWGNDEIPQEFIEARSKTQAAIGWATTKITF